jgi:pilus assembly protein CpaF
VEALERVVARLVESDAPLQRSALEPLAHRIAAEEAPLEGTGLAAAAVDALVGLGPLESLLADPEVTDVLVNGPDEVWLEKSGTLERTTVSMGSAAAVVAAVERVIAPLGLRLDRASPAVDARLPDGSRLHAIIPPAAVDGPVVAIRRFTPIVPDLEALVASGSIRPEGAGMLAEAVARRRSILVSGGTGSGKTTLLNILSREVPAPERVVTIEDSAELRLAGHVVRLEARPPNAEGAGEITLRALVRHALRMRPDRIVVGEVRGPEALDLVQAMSTGHPGSMGTIHANGPEEALWRLETLAVSGDRRVPEAAVRRQILSAIDLLVHMERRGPSRVVEAIAEVEGEGIGGRYRC